MATHQEPGYHQYIYHKQSFPDIIIIHALSYLLPILPTTRLVCFTALLKTGMICHWTFIHSIPTLNIYAIQIHPWCKKSKAKSEAPVTSIFSMRLKGVISGWGQGLLRFNHFVMQPFTIMCKQTETIHVDKHLKPDQLKEPTAMYNCGQRLSNSQL